ncbi:MAG: two-component sensor histidine kinase, partial [Brevundimonas sp.]|nr:two-component sensor histidine kinase [Brevundimonas sp.]
MAEADIAYVAAAGAAGLALAVSAWTWRFTARAATARSSLADQVTDLTQDVTRREAALAAFADVRMVVHPDGTLGTPMGDAEAVAALADLGDAVDPAALTALAQEGAPFDRIAAIGPRAWRIEGRAV